jgi:hypothetical protein
MEALKERLMLLRTGRLLLLHVDDVLAMEGKPPPGLLGDSA